MEVTPDWVQLADAKFWGLMVCVLAAASLGYGFIVYIVKQWLHTSELVSKHKSEQIAQLAHDANFHNEMMLKKMDDNTHAMTMLSETNRNIAEAIKGCPHNNGDD